MFRSFAIVPAAGCSARMGVPKLLLPLAGRMVIEHVLAAWTASAVTHTIVVVRAEDEEIIARCREFSVDVVAPELPPPDMKASVTLAISHIAERYAPNESDAWLLAPADLPRLSASLIDLVLHGFDPRDGAAVAPFAGAKRGHPIAMPWSDARRVFELGIDEGIDALVDCMPLRKIACESPDVFHDLDVPADYARLLDETAPATPVFH